MATRWTDAEENDLFDFVSENKGSSWEEVHSFMLGKNYNRTSEACRKRYKLLIKEKETLVEVDNDYVADITANLVAVLPTMSESDWGHETPTETPPEPSKELIISPIKESEELDEINLEEVSPVQECELLDKYSKEQKKDVVSTLWAILFIILCILLYNFIH